MSFIPFLSGDDGAESVTYSDGTPARAAAVSYGSALALSVEGGLSGTVRLPGFSQRGATLPVSCVLDTLSLTVGSGPITPEPGRTVHVFAMLATAEDGGQTFALRPEARAEVVLGPDSRLQPMHTVRATGLAVPLAAETRCIMVCGHYISGDAGATRYTFSYSGAMQFK